MVVEFAIESRRIHRNVGVCGLHLLDALGRRDDAEKAVTEAERRVGDLKRQLQDPSLYDGNAAKAKRAGQLDKELADAQRKLDGAMAKWAELEG